MFDHWVLFNISPTLRIEENKVPAHATQGLNGAGDIGYTGPCPPRGIHTYYFHLYALDTMLDVRQGSIKQQVLDAMQGHIIATSTLTATYGQSGHDVAAETAQA